MPSLWQRVESRWSRKGKNRKNASSPEIRNEHGRQIQTPQAPKPLLRSVCVCLCVCTCTRYLFIFKPPHFPLTLVMLFISCRKKELRGGKTRILREIALIPSKPGSSTDFVCIIDCVSRCKKTPPLKKQIIKTSIENVTDIS